MQSIYPDRVYARDKPKEPTMTPFLRFAPSRARTVKVLAYGDRGEQVRGFGDVSMKSISRETKWISCPGLEVVMVVLPSHRLHRFTQVACEVHCHCRRAVPDDDGTTRRNHRPTMLFISDIAKGTMRRDEL